MNERIKELADEAKMSTYLFAYGVEFNISIEKFAELIVKECLTIVDEQKECLHEEEKYWHDRDYGYALAVDDASKGIKKYFGVEE
jgi:hypothetical protein